MEEQAKIRRNIPSQRQDRQEIKTKRIVIDKKSKLLPKEEDIPPKKDNLRHPSPHITQIKDTINAQTSKNLDYSTRQRQQNKLGIMFQLKQNIFLSASTSHYQSFEGQLLKNKYSHPFSAQI